MSGYSLTKGDREIFLNAGGSLRLSGSHNGCLSRCLTADQIGETKRNQENTTIK